jgi:hypothetical protein
MLTHSRDSVVEVTLAMAISSPLGDESNGRDASSAGHDDAKGKDGGGDGAMGSDRFVEGSFHRSVNTHAEISLLLSYILCTR